MKKIILTLALIVPGLIFVWLKYAGKNEFNIPVYYEDGIPAKDGCDVSGAKPYRIPESWHSTTRSITNVLVFDLDEVEFEILDAALTGEFPEGLWLKEAKQLATDSIEFQAWRLCVFRVENPWQTVLFDKEGRIRGYYDVSNREELDRLRVEMKILQKKY